MSTQHFNEAIKFYFQLLFNSIYIATANKSYSNRFYLNKICWLVATDDANQGDIDFTVGIEMLIDFN